MSTPQRPDRDRLPEAPPAPGSYRGIIYIILGIILLYFVAVAVNALR